MSPSKATVLVTGGAGYIGACTCEALKREGWRPVVLDRRPCALEGVESHRVDLTEREPTRKILSQLKSVEGIIHFAALALVSESCQKPELYLRNNILSTLNVAELAVEFGIKNFVFSSSCSVYGNPKQLPISEDHSLSPVSPYGESKRIGELVLEKLAFYKGLRVLCLRYFNPAGSTAEGRLGEDHSPETHLIPNVVRAITEKKPVTIFGSDYETQDGSCVRDFIHIEDLVSAHELALQTLSNKSERFFQALNIGTGTGTSVREVIKVAEQVLDQRAEVVVGDRRPGDPPELYADNKLVQKVLGWRPKKGLADMIADHYRWSQLKR